MYKKIYIDKKDLLTQMPQFPHCDSRILHAPNECQFCDMHKDWQVLRVAWGIAFTGYEPEGKELPCPSNHARGADVDKQWSGNIPQPHSDYPNRTGC